MKDSLPRLILLAPKRRLLLRHGQLEHLEGVAVVFIFVFGLFLFHFGVSVVFHVSRCIDGPAGVLMTSFIPRNAPYGGGLENIFPKN